VNLPRAPNPFQFVTQVTLVELTGLKARDVRELLEHVKVVPGSVVYHHTHHFLRQHQFLSPEPPNDFAYWATGALKEERLGEQLAAIDTIQFTSIRALREKIVEVLERYLSRASRIREAPEGDEFHFMKSKSFVLPTPHRAYDLAEFADAIRKVSVHSLYHHIFEARLRIERGTNDFYNWLVAELQENELARSIGRLDPYTHTLEALRQRIVSLVEGRIRDILGEGVRAS